MAIDQKAEQFVFDLFKDNLSSEYTYHNFNHTLRVVTAVEKLAAAENVNDNERTALVLAAWFHDTGYISGAQDHEEKSIEILRQFAKEEEVVGQILQLTETLIRATDIKKTPENKLEYIIRDADSCHFGSKNYIETSELLREEWKLTQQKEFSHLDWALNNRNMLAQCHRFFTDYAKSEWQSQKDLNIGLLQSKIQELNVLKDEEKTVATKKKKKEEKENKPDRGIDTMFRVTLNNHTQLSQIADSKANILLSVNAIIISIALSILIPKLDSPRNAHLVMPTFIMLIFSVVSIIFAILSTRPKVTTGTFTRNDIEERKVNLLFFGNFYKMPIEEYQWAMHEVMSDRAYLYDSLIKDLYYLGLVLERKYKLLRITYNIFMVGIIVSVVAFVIAFKQHSA